MCSWRLPDRLEEKVMGPPLLQTTSRMRLQTSPPTHSQQHGAGGCPKRAPCCTAKERHTTSSRRGVLKPPLSERGHHAAVKHMLLLQDFLVYTTLI